jgi:hypothetical protein
MITIHCSASTVKECAAPGLITFPLLLYCLQVAMPLAGTILNSISLFIFANYSRSMSTKFLTYLRYSVLNSLIVTGHHLAFFTLTLLLVENIDSVGSNSYTSSLNYNLNFIYLYVWLPLWTVTYTFGSLLDILILYERILLYLPKIQFLRKVNLHAYLAVILALSILINVPANLSRDLKEIPLTLNGTVNISVYQFSKRSFCEYDDLFTIVLYASTFLRDILTLAIELVLTVFLVVTIWRFNRKKRRLLEMNVVSNGDSNSSEKIDLNQSKIIILICLLSSFNHIVTFLILVVTYFIDPSMHTNMVMSIVSGNTFLARSSLDFFILLWFNSKFRENFFRLVPWACSKGKKESTT